MLVVVVSVTLFVDRNTESVSNGGPAEEVRLRPVTGADGKPLPLEILPGFADGPPVDVGEFVGESLVVNFWATWCGPCVREMPMLRDMSSDMAGDVTFLGINVQDSPSQARAFLEDVGVEYVQAADPDGDYFRAVGGLGIADHASGRFGRRRALSPHGGVDRREAPHSAQGPSRRVVMRGRYAVGVADSARWEASCSATTSS